MSNSNAVGSSGRALSALRKAAKAAESEVELELLLKELDSDPRAGARELAGRIQRRLDAAAAERERMSGLLALRDRLVSSGVRGVAGIDEVGVGPLAGSVVAAAVVLPEQVVLSGLDDSKRVRPALREALAQEIKEVALGVGHRRGDSALCRRWRDEAPQRGRARDA